MEKSNQYFGVEGDSFERRPEMLVRRLDAELSRRIDSAVSPLELTYRQLVVLELVSQGHETAARLAASLGIDATSVTRALDRLERRGFVVRGPHPSDRRVKRLLLSSAGERVLPEALRLADANREWYLRNLDPGERGELVRLLSKALRYR